MLTTHSGKIVGFPAPPKLSRIWRFTADPATGVVTAIRRPGASSATTTVDCGSGLMARPTRTAPVRR